MQLSREVSERDHVRGDLAAAVVLVHYGDFECPFSGAAHPLIRELERQMGGALCVVFRPFPLDDVHPHALGAALAGEAAARQSPKHFWAMHDTMFEHQESLSPHDLLGYARQIGLDEAQFQRDIADSELEKAVRASIAGGRASGVHGTPTFWINERFHDNREALWEPDRLVAAINEAIN